MANWPCNDYLQKVVAVHVPDAWKRQSSCPCLGPAELQAGQCSLGPWDDRGANLFGSHLQPHGSQGD